MAVGKRQPQAGKFGEDIEMDRRAARPVETLDGRSLAPAVRDGRVDTAAICRNSDRLRDLMLSIAPAIVANAEAISSEVRYFAISPLGASPVEFTDSRGVKMIGPDPAKLAPMFVEIPTLWVLSRVAPGLIPSHPEA